MDQKILERLGWLESLNRVVPLNTSGMDKSAREIRKGALLFPAVQLAYEDNSDTIYQTIAKNLFLMDKESMVLKNQNERYKTIGSMVNKIGGFVDSYIANTGNLFSSVLDWTQSYMSRYIFYDSMTYDIMTSGYYGRFSAASNYFEFVDPVAYTETWAASVILIELLEAGRVIATSNTSAIKYSGFSSSKELRLKFSIKTNVENYGICVRSTVPYKQSGSEKLSTLTDIHPLNYNSSFEFVIPGMVNGPRYDYDFSIVLQPFYNSGDAFFYQSKKLDLATVKNEVMLTAEYGQKFVATYINKKVDDIVFDEKKNASYNDTSVISVSDNKQHLQKLDGYKKPTSVEPRENEYLYHWGIDLLDGSQKKFIYGPLFYGTNCLRNNKKNKTITTTIDIAGQYTYKLADIYKDASKDIIDIPVTIKNESPFQPTVEIINGVSRTVRSLSVYGETSTIYVSENSMIFTEVSTLSDVVGNRKVFFRKYNAAKNTTTIYTGDTNTPNKIVYTVSLLSLITKSGFKITSASITTDFAYHNFGFFGADAENSMYLITPDGFIKNPQLDIDDIHQHLVDNNVDRIAMSMSIVLENKQELMEMSCSIYGLENASITLPLNSGEDNLMGKQYLIDDLQVSTLDVVKNENREVVVYGDMEYIAKIFLAVSKIKEIILYSGTMLKFSEEKATSAAYTKVNMGGKNKIAMIFNISSDISSSGNLVPIAAYTYTPLTILYAVKSISEDIEYKVKLTSNYNGYIIKRLSLYGR